MERESFVVYKSFVDAIGMLPREQQLECYEALFKYGFEGIEEPHEGAVNMFMALVKPQIDKNNQRYENGTRGGRPKTDEEKPNNNQTKTKPKPNNNQTKTKAKPNETKPEPNVNVNVNDNVSVNDSVSVSDNESASENVSLSESEHEDVRQREREPNPLTNSFVVLAAFEKFRRSRQQMERPLTEDSEPLMWEKLRKYSGDDPELAVKILNQAIEGGYYTLVPYKEGLEQKTGTDGGRSREEMIENVRRRRAAAKEAKG